MVAFVHTPVPLRASLTKATISRSAFMGRRATTAPVVASKATVRMQQLPVFTNAMAEFKAEYPDFAKRGWGATVKAERWNGRHVMAGWVILVATGFVKGHGLIPDASVPLDLKQWGTLAALGNQQPITNERAIILIAHVHLLFVSVAAALAPFAFQDKLLLAPGEEDEKPAGLIPPLTFGLTKDAEMWNGRVAMLGLMVLVGASVATKTPILDTLNKGLGNLLF
ncbi:hypothetical protein I4F81_009612 [Pyropia yezoensis]|uniref:Uncharacterized protein n=1 Tax=Pyropia yezoensis TaxID=2788 RepID=A0ACC3CB70_PYRYE|nr:hypothetical protein I4F81_009612 [Neopyropia yezoensis]